MVKIEQCFIKLNFMLHWTLVYKDMKLTEWSGVFTDMKRNFPTGFIVVFVQLHWLDLDKNYDKTIDCKKKNMDKASVTSPIDFLKNSFDAVYGGYGRRHIGKYKIQMFRKDTEVVWCVVSDHGRQIPLGAARYQLSVKVNRPYLSCILYLNTI